MNTEQDRRRFHRFPFDAECALSLEDDIPLACQLLDLSINGALVRLDAEVDEMALGRGTLRLTLIGHIQRDQVELSMLCKAVRLEGRQLACRFVAIDRDSFANLQRLVADNLGDVLMLDRELTQLDYWPGMSLEPAG